MGIKKLATERATAIEVLKTSLGDKDQEIRGRDEEIKVLKARCDTLEYVYPAYMNICYLLLLLSNSKIVSKFSEEYHSLKDSDGGGGRSIVFADIKPIPPPRKRDDYPGVNIWSKADLVRITKPNKGETNGESNTAIPKAKAGHPRKGEQTTSLSNIYLQNRDGTQISADQLEALSFAARVAWLSLLKMKWAPPTFCRMSYEAWDFYAGVMLNDPDFEYLLYCDDAKWKLREWSKQNYSSWSGTVGIREKNVGSKKTNLKAEGKMDPSALDDPGLIRMKADDELDKKSDDIERTPGPSNSEEDREKALRTEDDPDDARNGDDTLGRSGQVRSFPVILSKLTYTLRPPLWSCPRNPSCPIHCKSSLI